MRRQNSSKPEVRGLDSSGVMDRGAVNFKSRLANHEGDIMAIASKDVITLPPTANIMTTTKTMVNHGFRRVPIADAGTNRLEGIVTSLDIVDFLGGGLRHNLVKNKHDGNLAAAINENVKEIMNEDVVSVNINDTISQALATMIEQNIGGFPVVDGDNKVVAILSERDFVRTIANVTTLKQVKEYKSEKVVTAGPDMPVGEATRTMINKGFRRIPVVRENILLGIITASDIMRYLASGDIFQKLITGNVEDAFNVPIKSMIMRDIVWTSSNVDIGKAAGKMLDKNVGALPVIDDGELCGIITERDIVRALVD